MAISVASQLGTILGSNLSSANDYKDTFIATEDINSINYVGVESIALVGSYFVTSRVITPSYTWGLTTWNGGLWSSTNFVSSTLFTSGTF